jgi:hypothetical protein
MAARDTAERDSPRPFEEIASDVGDMLIVVAAERPVLAPLVACAAARFPNARKGISAPFRAAVRQLTLAARPGVGARLDTLLDAVADDGLRGRIAAVLSTHREAVLEAPAGREKLEAPRTLAEALVAAALHVDAPERAATVSAVKVAVAVAMLALLVAELETERDAPEARQ